MKLFQHLNKYLFILGISISCAGAKPIVYSLSPAAVKANCIALTFDDGPHKDYTPQILLLLAKYKIKATFFVLGSNAKKYPGLLQAIKEGGHELANHSTTHPNFNKCSFQEMKDQIEKAQTAIAPFQEDVFFFRPPYGSNNKTLRDLLEKKNMQIVMWNADSLDWKRKQSPQAFCNAFLPEVKAGSILLFHDIQKRTPAYIAALLPKLLEKGYKFVTIGEGLKGA